MDQANFHQELTMSVDHPQNEGELTLCGEALPYSAPASLNGKGVGTNPEELLISAVGACFSLTLAATLSARKLPAERLKVAADGVVVRGPALEFQSLTVHPTIYAAAEDRADDYRRAAEAALQRCFIGGLISAKVAYHLGDVALVPAVTEKPPRPRLLRAAWLPPQREDSANPGRLASSH
ncbi:MAG TPA: OsmC family protein [Gammaproteobacteria bacterium]|nr:OsmC family protein [Gammaproteobacteria bacterium]